jgi:hypothetical protein
MRVQMAEWTVILDRMERELEDHQTSGHSTVMCPSSTAAEFGYEFMGQSFSAHDGADVLLLILRLFAKQAPEFPERFRRAVEPLGRTRPYKELYGPGYLVVAIQFPFFGRYAFDWIQKEWQSSPSTDLGCFRSIYLTVPHLNDYALIRWPPPSNA